jgi:hypothetical protein
MNVSLKTLLAIGFLLLSGVMLFGRLGQYALWDDESMTALGATGVLGTGDTTAVHGGNVAAYREGLLLKNLHDRSTPPLATYLSAVSLGVSGSHSGFAARLPFALIGLALMGVAVVLVGRIAHSSAESFIWYIAILGNVSLILFLRQCRYYAPAILLSVLIAYLYLRWRRSVWGLVLIALLASLLFAANYMNCVALLVCMGLDYLIWKRRNDPLTPWQISIFAGLIGLPCLLVASVWNPLATKFGSYTHANSFWDRLTLVWWNLRDMNEAGFLVAGLLLLALYLAIFKKDHWMARGLTMIIAYVAVISLVSPQLVHGAVQADIRYLAPLIPFCIALGASAFNTQFRSRRTLALAFALPVFWTNLLNGTFLPPQEVRSIPFEYFGELLSPPPEPYTSTAKWVNQYVPKGSTVWVLPDYAAYPLMFHAPEALYSWQLNPEQKKDPQFKNLPDIHFKGVVLPYYIIVFGPMVVQIRGMLQEWKQQGADYEEIYRINTFWKDLYRPELFWRAFKPITGFDPETQAIYIFKRTPPS